MSYFTADSLKFLRDLARHNEKAWFEANRARFEEGVKAPALQLIADLAPAARRISPHLIADPRPSGGSLSRMNRDIRFSKDKSPYKTALFIHLWHDRGTDDVMPALYMHLEPGASTVGGGIWRPSTKPLKQIRDAIVAEPATWKKVRAAGLRGACAMGGESLKRVPPGYDQEHPFAEDLKRKDFGMHAELGDAALTSGKLVKEISACFAAAGPLLRFLCEAVGLPF